jgi:hypothetical protein
LKTAAVQGDATVRLAVANYASELLEPDQRSTSLIKALREAGHFSGLTQALDETATFHPPEVITELWRGLRQREGDIAVHFAAMLYHLYGKTEEIFDWDLRPFFLRFNTDDPAERESAIQELCTKVGEAPEPVAGKKTTARRK